MAVNAGYKQTDAGVIPEAWDAKPISDIAFVTSGKRLPLGSSLTDRTTPHPYVRVTDMRPGTVDLSELKYVPESAFPAISRYRIFRGDIFISVAGTLGLVGKVPRELDGACLTENADRLTSIECSQDYLLQVLMSPLIQRTIDSIRTVGAQPKLALGRIRAFAIPLPRSKAEQEAIASALRDADGLIESLEQLIAKKRLIKQGAMQELLTGKKRLPGLSEAWIARCLGDIGHFSKGRGIKKDEVEAEGVPCIRYGEIYTYHDDYIRDFRSFIPRAIASQSQRLVKGDLLFAGSGETAEEIGKCVAFLGDEEAYAGGDIVICNPIGQDSLFLAYLMNDRAVCAQKARLGQGDAVVHISARSLAGLELRVPPLSEQVAIATVLSDVDAELTALEAKLTKARHIKQGMMQELLTGRIRLA